MKKLCFVGLLLLGAAGLRPAHAESTLPDTSIVVGAEYQDAVYSTSKGGKVKLEPLDATSAPQPQPGEEFAKSSAP